LRSIRPREGCANGPRPLSDRQQPVVLDMLARSLVFLTPRTIDAVLNRGFPSTALTLSGIDPGLLTKMDPVK
jgi:hypothetical protein